MRSILLLAIVFLITASSVLADTTAPVASAQTSVLVLPFTPPAASEYQWTGQSVRQVLAADLAHGSKLKVMAPASAQPAADSDAALKSAADAGASIVVFGQTQVLDKEVRLTGEVLDVSTGRSIGGLKATGPVDELFHLEDAVASQVLSALVGSTPNDESRQGSGNATEPSQDSGAPPPVVYNQSAAPSDGYSYASPSYSYPSYAYPSYYSPGYAYPAYSYAPYSYYYPYGFYGSAFIVVGDFHDHDDHHDHGDNHDHGDYHGSDSHGNGWNGNSSHGNSVAGNSFNGSAHSGNSVAGNAGSFARGSNSSSAFSAGRAGAGARSFAGGGGTSAGGFSGRGFSGGGFAGHGIGGGGMGGGGMGGGFHGGMGGHR